MSSLRSTLVRAAAAVGFAAAMVSVAACHGDPLSTTAPDTTPVVDARQGLLSGTLGLAGDVVKTAGSLLTRKALWWQTPVERPITRSVTVQRNKPATLRIPELGFTLDIPAEAISSRSLVISVTALPGNGVAYSFEPHGTQFRKPLVVRQELAFTRASGLQRFGAGYFKDDAQVNPRSGLVLLDELLSARLWGRTVSFDIEHFSGYMVSVD
jgi:hypothetical protein